MFKLIFPIITVFTLLSSFQSEAQSRRYGSDGQIIENGNGTGPRSNNGPNGGKEKVDYTKLMIDNLTKRLSLDAFQNAILGKIFEEYNEKVVQISSENIPIEAKSEKIKTAQTAMDDRITEILTEEQKSAFVAMKDAKKDDKKGNKKNKKKKNSESEEDDNELF